MTKRNKFYQIGFFALAIAFIGLCLFVGITAVQKQMKLNLAVKMNPSILCGIYVDDTLVFDNVNSTIGDGVELTANTLKLNSTSTFGQSFNLKIANKNANAIYVTFSGATISGSTSYSTVINASTTSSAMALSSAGMVTITMQQVVQVTTNIVQCTYTTDASSGIIEANGKKYIPYGGTLKQTFTSNAGYSTPPTLSVTMGGETTTAYTYTNGVFTFSNVTADIVVNASCNPITYTVAYNANGGSGSIASQTHTYGTSLALSPCTFTAPEGKEFAGWAEASSGEVKYTDGESVSNLATTQDEVVTLYAVWKDALPYTIKTYDGTNSAWSGYYCVEFGEYPQTLATETVTLTSGEANKTGAIGTGASGAKYYYQLNVCGQGTTGWYKFEPIRWIVIAASTDIAGQYGTGSSITKDVTGTKQLLLLSEFGLYREEFNSSYANGNKFFGSTVQTSLNDSFAELAGLSQYFASGATGNYIAKVTPGTTYADSSDNEQFDSTSSYNMFLLGNTNGSDSNVDTYHWDEYMDEGSKQMQCVPTGFAKTTGVYYDLNYADSVWWLRSGYLDDFYAYRVLGSGSVTMNGVSDDYSGVRPSFILNLA